ncbi:hypothetical protein E2C01_039955 [Portunus trituberculatus]|uniref:Uncharacterized protein n=1 Tax=Portunus trituberculatus TaxID=210409 RepID=A0A5B7FG43_PORTR|nr:hypothetical protein [Portunus trituberculatus]
MKKSMTMISSSEQKLDRVKMQLVPGIPVSRHMTGRQLPHIRVRGWQTMWQRRNSREAAHMNKHERGLCVICRKAAANTAFRGEKDFAPDFQQHTLMLQVEEDALEMGDAVQGAI